MKDKKLIGKKSILGTNYKYYFESNLKNESDESLAGDCCPVEKEIRIDPKSNFNKTIIHETCHALLFESGIHDVTDGKIIELICTNMEKLDDIFIIQFKKLRKTKDK